MPPTVHFVCILDSFHLPSDLLLQVCAALSCFFSFFLCQTNPTECLQCLCEAVVTMSCEHISFTSIALCVLTAVFFCGSVQGSSAVSHLSHSFAFSHYSALGKTMALLLPPDIALLSFFINTFFRETITALMLVIASHHGMPTDNAGAFSFIWFAFFRYANHMNKKAVFKRSGVSAHHLSIALFPQVILIRQLLLTNYTDKWNTIKLLLSYSDVLYH